MNKIPRSLAKIHHNCLSLRHLTRYKRNFTRTRTLTQTFVSVSDEINSVLVTLFLVTNDETLTKNVASSLLKHKWEGRGKKSNNTGNCKTFCVTRKRKKIQLLIQIDIFQRVRGVEGSDQFRISLLDLALILNIYFSLHFIFTKLSSFSGRWLAYYFILVPLGSE